MAKRRVRPLINDAHVNVKMPSEVRSRLTEIADKKGYTTKKGETNLSKLLREILKSWVWGYDHGPGKTTPPKPKNERLDV